MNWLYTDNNDSQWKTYISWLKEMGLARLESIVNINNILQAAFLPKFFCQKITKPNCK